MFAKMRTHYLTKKGSGNAPDSARLRAGGALKQIESTQSAQHRQRGHL